MGAVGSCITRPPSPKIWRPRTEGAQYLITRVALPILPVAVSGGLVCAHALLRTAIMLANTRTYFIRFFSCSDRGVSLHDRSIEGISRAEVFRQINLWVGGGGRVRTGLYQGTTLVGP